MAVSILEVLAAFALIVLRIREKDRRADKV